MGAEGGGRRKGGPWRDAAGAYSGRRRRGFRGEGAAPGGQRVAGAERRWRRRRHGDGGGTRAAEQPPPGPAYIGASHRRRGRFIASRAAGAVGSPARPAPVRGTVAQRVARSRSRGRRWVAAAGGGAAGRGGRPCARGHPRPRPRHPGRTDWHRDVCHVYRCGRGAAAAGTGAAAPALAVPANRHHRPGRGRSDARHRRESGRGGWPLAQRRTVPILRIRGRPPLDTVARRRHPPPAAAPRGWPGGPRPSPPPAAPPPTGATCTHERGAHQGRSREEDWRVGMAKRDGLVWPARLRPERWATRKVTALPRLTRADANQTELCCVLAEQEWLRRDETATRTGTATPIRHER